MFTPHVPLNARPDGFPVLQLPGGRFAPLARTDLAGTVTGPLARLTLTQVFVPSGSPSDPPIEAVYRFPLPGDAAVLGVTVWFGDTEVRTTLKERAAAEAEYAAGKRAGKQSALLTRETPDVFTLSVAGLTPGQEVRVETAFVQLARGDGDRFALRVPLTTAPRFVRADEAGTRPAAGNPLAVLRDPGHRFACDLELRGTGPVTSPTHAVAAAGDRLRLADVVPDRDFVLMWAGTGSRLSVWAEPDPTTDTAVLLALAVTPPAPPTDAVPREVLLLVDHSGSMQGPKWEAADWAVERFLASLTDRDRFALGVFHNTCRWAAAEPQPATAGAVRQAVQFLKAARDQGGTELGVALEQALRQPRADGRVSRHVLIVTDAEVTDAGRLLRLVEAEADRPDRRRVSVLCIDAAPNAALATELAERGGGVSRFLTSDPAADDITTALDEVLADWDAPAAVGLALELNRPTADAVGRLVSVRVPGPSAAIDLGDPPAGRPVWAAARVPLAGGPLAVTLTAGSAVLAEASADLSAGVPGLAALVGSDRIRRLERLMHSRRPADELKDQLDRLGVTADPSVYAENATASLEARVKPVLVRESLAAGLPCSETAFVAVRTEAGQPVGETVVVANALPAGWGESPGTLYSGITKGGSAVLGAAHATLGSPAPMPAPAPAAGQVKLTPEMVTRLRSMSQTGRRVDASFEEDTDNDAAPAALAPRAGTVLSKLAKMAGTVVAGGSVRDVATTNVVRVSVPAGRHPTAAGAVLFDSGRDVSPLPDACRLTGLTLTGPASGPGLTLLVFVGDPSAPRAKVKLADLLKAGRRPLNLRKSAGQAVRLVLDDPSGEWSAGVPPLELSLTWE